MHALYKTSNKKHLKSKINVAGAMYKVFCA